MGVVCSLEADMCPSHVLAPSVFIPMQLSSGIPEPGLATMLTVRNLPPLREHLGSSVLTGGLAVERTYIQTSGTAAHGHLRELLFPSTWEEVGV